MCFDLYTDFSVVTLSNVNMKSNHYDIKLQGSKHFDV